MSTHLDLDDVCAGHPKAQQELAELRAELAEWRKLRDHEALHVNLLRGQPAQLSRATFLHLAGADQLQERIKVLERLVIDAAYTLDKARIWNGMGWAYNPLDPIHYTPMRDRLRNECDKIAAALAKDAP